jgi:hypothetical protein
VRDEALGSPRTTDSWDYTLWTCCVCMQVTDGIDVPTLLPLESCHLDKWKLWHKKKQEAQARDHELVPLQCETVAPDHGRRHFPVKFPGAYAPLITTFLLHKSLTDIVLVHIYTTAARVVMMVRPCAHGKSPISHPSPALSSSSSAGAGRRGSSSGGRSSRTASQALLHAGDCSSSWTRPRTSSYDGARPALLPSIASSSPA